MNDNDNWVNFELGEDVRDDNRLTQDKKWASAVQDGRAHVSHRELAMMNAPQISMIISEYRLVEAMVSALACHKSIMSKITSEILTHIVDYAMPGQGHLVAASLERRKLGPIIQSVRGMNTIKLNQDFPFRICVRKRPILDFEAEYGCYDVCDTDNENIVTLHEGRLARNGRQIQMNHHQYVVDHVFNENDSNLKVCSNAIEPLLNWSILGNDSTVLCFGQTGTGKTYTLYGALEFISKKLVGYSVRVTFFEVHGKKYYDLLSNRNVIHLRSDGNETMHIRGAKTVDLKPLQNSQQMIEVLKDALQLRSSKVTERNPISSRSHAVCVIEIGRNNNDDSNSKLKTNVQSLHDFLKREKKQHQDNNNSFLNCGKITLVDLAGSERNYETQKMTAKEHQESADINFALMALKNCFRAFYTQLLVDAAGKDMIDCDSKRIMAKLSSLENQKAASAANIATGTDVVDSNGRISKETGKNIRIPFRSSQLTKVLKQCFTSGKNHRTTVIATVSPSPTDIQHSINTLAHVVLMCPILNELVHRINVDVPLALYGKAHMSKKPVKDWTHKEVCNWIAYAEKGRFAHVVLPPNIDGAGMLLLSANNLAELFTSQTNMARNVKEGNAWVETAMENDRKVRMIGKALWSAIRREMQSITARNSVGNSYNM